jgi:hypothetical protein
LILHKGTLYEKGARQSPNDPNISARGQ